jgi:DNA polymerase
VVFGSGNVNASLLIVGDAPDRDDDIAGKPFAGAAGQLLTKMLAAIKLDRDKDAFLTTVVKCRPSEDRTPEAVEIHTCRSILMRQIEIMKPQMILLLGRVAAHAMLESSENVSALRARAHRIGAIPAVVTYHPAALLRDETLKRPAWEDLQKLQALLGELNAAGR